MGCYRDCCSSRDHLKVDMTSVENRTVARVDIFSVTEYQREYLLAKYNT